MRPEATPLGEARGPLIPLAVPADAEEGDEVEEEVLEEVYIHTCVYTSIQGYWYTNNIAENYGTRSTCVGR